MSKAFEDWYADYSKCWGQSVKDDVSQDIDVIEAAWDAALHHAAELAKQAKPSAKDLSREEWIAVEITHDAIAKKIYNGLSN